MCFQALTRVALVSRSRLGIHLSRNVVQKSGTVTLMQPSRDNQTSRRAEKVEITLQRIRATPFLDLMLCQESNSDIPLCSSQPAQLAHHFDPMPILGRIWSGPPCALEEMQGAKVGLRVTSGKPSTE